MIFSVSVIIRAEYLSIKYEKKQNMYSVMVDYHCWLELWGILSHTQYTLFNDLTRDSIANNFVVDVYCRCLQILYQIAFFYKI